MRHSIERARMPAVTVNGRTYQAPQDPTVIICIDGGDPAYFRMVSTAVSLPALQHFREQGCFTTAKAVVPTFTNPNNLSIVTGVPPAIHGISGNFFLDPESGTEVMMNDPRFLRAGSIHAALSQHGTRVAVITARTNSRRLLGHGVHQGICFSAEKAHEAQQAEHGIDDVNTLVGWDTPEVYSSQLSEFVLEAGLARVRALSAGPDVPLLTDYIQHKHAPGTVESDRFHQCLDQYFGAFDARGAIVGITADHGMNDKNNALGQPQIIYLSQLLSTWFGAEKARVILPITDPYVVHHGALGSFATVYLDANR